MTRLAKTNFGFVILCFVGFAVSHAEAAIVFSDAFDYPDGPLPGSNGGTGFTNGWSGNGAVDTGVAVMPGQGNGLNTRHFNEFTLGVGDSYYLGFDFAHDQPGDSLAGISLGAQLLDPAFFVGQSFGESTLSIEFWEGRRWVASNVPVASAMNRVVLGIQRIDATQVTLGLYATPIALNSGTADLTYTQATNRMTLGSLRVSNGPAESRYDNLVFSTQFGDAVGTVAIPEPGVVLPATCLAAVVVGRRRR